MPVATTRLNGQSVEVNGSYNTDIAAEYGAQEFVVRPTGYYLAAGDIASVSIPPGFENAGFSIIVGVHFRDMPAGKVNRFRDVSVEYPLDAATIQIANPFGGGIYLKVPDGSIAGWFNMTIDNAVKSPYFSWRNGRETLVADWLAEVSASGAPWADFESDKYMFTIPSSALAGVTNPDLIMTRWDEIMDAFRYVGGRPVDGRIRAEFYTLDTKLVTRAYGAGYPLVITLNEFFRANSSWNPLNVILYPPASILLHEMGHNAVHPTMQYYELNPCQFEAETIVHLPATYFLESIYGLSRDAAFAGSGASSAFFNYNDAAFDWMISSNFRTNLPMSYDEDAPIADQDQLKYQHRGWAKYGDFANLFGWNSLNAVFANYYNEGLPPDDTICPDKPFVAGRDEFINYASIETGANMAPLFHFWGINPTPAMAGSLSGLPKSQKVKELIEAYRCDVAPKDFADYQLYHDMLYDRSDYQQPRYDEYQLEFGAAYANQIDAQFDLILSTYGLIGPNQPDALSTLIEGIEQVTVNWSDNSSDETGFVVRQKHVSESEFTIVTTTAANATSHTIYGLQLGSYTYMISAINAEGLESSHCGAEQVTAVVSDVPDIPPCTGSDSDSDFVNADCDNCPWIFNPTQSDTDSDAFGDVCDTCPSIFNPDQDNVDITNTVAVWRFDEETGTTASDSMGSNDGRVNGASWTTGQVGNALSFSGVGDEVVVDNSVSLHINGPITVMAWIKVGTFDKEWQAIITKGHNSWRLHRSGSGSTVAFGTTGLSNQELNGTTAVDDGNWHHVTGVWDGTTKYIYIDAIEENQAVATGTIPINGYGIAMGANLAMPNRNWNGQIDEVAIFDRALTGTEIDNIYQSGLSLDFDGDGVPGGCDICPGSDDNGPDADSDGVPDDCDACPLDATNDADGDGVCGDVDNCPADSNADQADADIDGLGDVCDLCNGDDASGDTDSDGVCDNVDPCILDNPDDPDSDSYCASRFFN